MIKEIFFIKEWKITLFIIYNKYNSELFKKLLDLNCNYNQALEIYTYINKKNIGFTFYNLYKKEIILVIGKQTNISNLVNTISHESRHLQQIIANYYLLNENSEEVCYLLGNIMQTIYEILLKHSINNRKKI